MNFNEVSTMVNSGLGDIGLTATAIDAVKTIYSATQQLRFNNFIRACGAQLREQGNFSIDDELQIINLFKTDFARKQAYEFIRIAIEANSEITRAAMGRLYVKCATRTTPSVSWDDLILLKAYESIDDSIARLVLYLEKNFPHETTTEHEKRLKPFGQLQIPRECFNQQNNDFLQRFGIEGVDELEERVNVLGRLSVYRANQGFTSSYALNISRNKRTSTFLSDLRWAVANIEPNSDLI